MKLRGTSSNSRRADDELAPTRASLLLRLKNLNDEVSWRDFFDTYHPLIYGHVINRGLPPQDAEDIVAEIVQGVARRIPEFVYDPSRCSFKTWLFRVVSNRVAEHFRRRGRSLPQAQLDTNTNEMLEQIPDLYAVQPDREWDDAWSENHVRVVLERVRKQANPRYLQLYIYTEMEGHSVKEAAEHLQTTPNDVSVAKHRISAMLLEESERLHREERRREEEGGQKSRALR